MAHQRLSNRSFVSYIDKSREYYEAQGYPSPYGWAFHEDSPFTQLNRLVTDCTIGIVTTAFFPKGDEPEGVPEAPPKRPYAAPSDPIPVKLYIDDVSWDKQATDMDDLGSYLPLQALMQKKQEGKIGAVSQRFYGIPTDYSQRRSLEDAQQILSWCREDAVDAVLLVPV